MVDHLSQHKVAGGSQVAVGYQVPKRGGRRPWGADLADTGLVTGGSLWRSGMVGHSSRQWAMGDISMQLV